MPVSSQGREAAVVLHHLVRLTLPPSISPNHHHGNALHYLDPCISRLDHCSRHLFTLPASSWLTHLGPSPGTRPPAAVGTHAHGGLCVEWIPLHGGRFIGIDQNYKRRSPLAQQFHVRKLILCTRPYQSRHRLRRRDPGSDRGARPWRQRCDQRPGPQKVSKPTRRPRLLSADWSVRLTGSGTEGEGCRAAARAAAVPKGGRGHRCSQSQTRGTALQLGTGTASGRATQGRGEAGLSCHRAFCTVQVLCVERVCPFPIEIHSPCLAHRGRRPF